MKYFLIEYTSEYVYSDVKKIKVDTVKQAIEYAKTELQYLRDDYLLPSRRHKDDLHYKDDYQYLHKRFRVSHMYVDTKDGETKITGKVVSITGRPKDNDTDETVISAWIHHIPKDKLDYYSDFEGVD